MHLQSASLSSQYYPRDTGKTYQKCVVLPQQLANENGLLRSKAFYSSINHELQNLRERLMAVLSPCVNNALPLSGIGASHLLNQQITAALPERHRVKQE